MHVLGLFLRFIAEIVQQQQQACAHHGNGGRLQAQRVGQNEAGDDQRKHDHRLFEQGRVGDRLAFSVLHHARPRLVIGDHVPAPYQPDHNQRHDHDEGRDGRQVDQEIIEAEPHRRADHDVGRIADEGRRAPDIGSEYFGEQERVGVEMQFLGDQQGHRCDQQHRGHVVEQRGEHGGHHRKHQQDAPGARLHLFRGPYGDVLEYPATAGDGHDHHHARQQSQGVEIHAVDRLILVQDAQRDHQGGAQPGHDGAVDPLGYDQQVGQDKEDG